MRRVIITATVKGETKRDVLEIAKEEKRSLSGMIEIALDELINNRKNKNK